jgi:hypothetical protein
MQIEDLEDYLIPRDDPGDATFKGTEQETLSASQEGKLRQLVRQVRAQYDTGNAKDLLKLFDTTNPESVIFRQALAKDIEEHPELYKENEELKKQKEKAAEEYAEKKVDERSWSRIGKNFAKGAAWFALPTIAFAGVPKLWHGVKWVGSKAKGLFGGKYKNKKRSKNKIKKRKKYYY